jgi:hypothetical protein
VAQSTFPGHDSGPASTPAGYPAGALPAWPECSARRAGPQGPALGHPCPAPPTPMGPKREIKLVSRLQAIKLRAQLERRLAPDGSVTLNQQNNFYRAIPVDIIGLPPETLEKLMAHAQELEALGVLPAPRRRIGSSNCRRRCERC